MIDLIDTTYFLGRTFRREIALAFENNWQAFFLVCQVLGCRLTIYNLQLYMEPSEPPAPPIPQATEAATATTLVPVNAITEFDVLVTTREQDHPGTTRLAGVIREFIPKYYRANNRAEEMDICFEIIRRVNHDTDGRVRFLRPHAADAGAAVAAAAPQIQSRASHWRIMHKPEILSSLERILQRSCQQQHDRQAMQNAVIGCRVVRKKKEPPTTTAFTAFTPPSLSEPGTGTSAAAAVGGQQINLVDRAAAKPAAEVETGKQPSILRSSARLKSAYSGEKLDSRGTGEMPLRPSVAEHLPLARESCGAGAGSILSVPQHPVGVVKQSSGSAQSQRLTPSQTRSGKNFRTAPRSARPGSVVPRVSDPRLSSQAAVAPQPGSRLVAITLADRLRLQSRTFQFTKDQEAAAKTSIAAVKAEIAQDSTNTPVMGLHLGKAWHFSKTLLAIHGHVTRKHPNVAHLFGLVTEDTVVSLVERLLIKQSEFQADKKPFRVEIGYHHTKSDHIEGIRSHGLLTREDQKNLGVVAKLNGKALGDGVYTANSPHRYLGRYGNAGLLVLRVRGSERVGRMAFDGTESDSSDTVLDKQWPNTGVVLLKTSSQCVALVHYDSSDMKRFQHGTECHITNALTEYHLCVKVSQPLLSENRCWLRVTTL